MSSTCPCTRPAADDCASAPGGIAKTRATAAPRITLRRVGDTRPLTPHSHIRTSSRGACPRARLLRSAWGHCVKLRRVRSGRAAGGRLGMREHAAPARGGVSGRCNRFGGRWDDRRRRPLQEGEAEVRNALAPVVVDRDVARGRIAGVGRVVGAGLLAVLPEAEAGGSIGRAHRVAGHGRRRGGRAAGRPDAPRRGPRRRAPRGRGRVCGRGGAWPGGPRARIGWPAGTRRAATPRRRAGSATKSRGRCACPVTP